MKEIGGYLELEQFCGEEYYQDMVKLNLGRTALLYILKAVDAQELWVPRFLCDSVTNACEKAGYRLRYYNVNSDLEPVLEALPEAREYLYLVNYYGKMTNDKIMEYREKYNNIIVDNTHAFYQEPLQMIPTLYSLRKFFGLSDGAYVSFGGMSTWLDSDMLEQDISNVRMKHVLGRYEEDASVYYKSMLENASSFNAELVKRMSGLTENLLRGIDYKRVKETRESNYKTLETLLGPINRLDWEMPEGPFTYPFYYKNGIELRKRLAKERVFVPTYWGNVIESMEADSIEYDSAANILPLPCDQRYDSEDMRRVAETCMECMRDMENA